MNLIKLPLRSSFQWKYWFMLSDISWWFYVFRLRDAFAQFDSDGDGKLSRKEIEKAMGNMLSEADLDDLLTDLDGDGDGEVEWDEFLHAMKARMREPESIKALKEAFR